MRKLGLALPALAALAGLGLCLGWEPAFPQGIGSQPIVCNKVVSTAALSAGTTQLVTGQVGQLVDICGFNFQQLAVGTIQLVAGTGASCTSPTNITGSFVLAANNIFVVDHLATAFFSSLTGQSICAVVTGTSSVALDLYYAQP